jgi:hypothetical protein
MDHEHDSRQVMICQHVIDNPEALGMLWLGNGLVLAALCLLCAREANNPEAQPETIRNLCADCARRDGLPVAMKMVDGFYERHGGQWIRQPDAEDVVN